MIHRCLNCGETLDTDSEDFFNGCSNCGSKFFIFQDEEKQVEKRERRSFIRDVESILQEIDLKEGEIKENLEDLGSIKVLKDGVYEINMNKLTDDSPLIVELKEGTYHVHLPSVFKKGKEKKISIKDLEL